MLLPGIRPHSAAMTDDPLDQFALLRAITAVLSELVAAAPCDIEDLRMRLMGDRQRRAPDAAAAGVHPAHLARIDFWTDQLLNDALRTRAERARG